MPRYRNEPEFRHDAAPRLGVLLSNLGTPDSPTPGAVRRYLAEFLWDPRVIEVPRPAWWLALHGIILRTRPRRSAHAYAQVWTEAGSPLLVNTLAQARALRAELESRIAGPFTIATGMRYGKPALSQALRTLAEANVTRLLVLPLYPQYSATTTASTFDAVSAELRTWRRQPELRFVNGYADAPGYIEALAASVREHRRTHGTASRLLFSFHGIPQRCLDLGDPYHCLCYKTARLTAAALGLDTHEWHVSFQSRLGPTQWLRPYTDEVLAQWAGEGGGDIDVICPGFAADCLETLEEVAMRYSELYREAGGGTLRYIAALNDRSDHVAFLASLVQEHSHGWPQANASGPDAAAAARVTAERAIALGATQ